MAQGVKNFITVFSVLIVWFSGVSGNAQETQTNHAAYSTQWWSVLGGVSVFESNHGVNEGAPAIGFNYNKCTGKRLYTWQIMYFEEFSILGPSPVESLTDMSFLYSFFSKQRKGFYSIGGGVGVLYGVQRGNFLRSEGWFSNTFESDRFLVPCLPLLAQCSFVNTNKFGVGINLYCELTAKHSAAGVLLSLSFGQLK